MCFYWKWTSEINNKEVDIFSNHDNAILYVTSDENFKILSAREKNANEIECKPIEFDIYYAFSKFDINLYNINNGYEATFSYNENNCIFTNYENEYLICCSITDDIICDKRDIDFNLINSFSIYSTGKITNLTLEIREDSIKLIYSNEIYLEKGIYEHYIYYPDCIDFNVLINYFETRKVSLNELFQRKTMAK